MKSSVRAARAQLRFLDRVDLRVRSLEGLLCDGFVCEGDVNDTSSFGRRGSTRR